MKHLITFFLLLFSISSFGQDYYLIHLRPKTNTQNYFSNPQTMLSERALQRRLNRNVSLDDKDVPIAISSINQIKNLNLTYIGASKWLNALMVEISSPEVISQIENLPFVLNVESLVRNQNRGRNVLQSKFQTNNTINFNYGYANDFVAQLEINALHEAGFSGQNILIGVIDSGFPGVNTIPALQHLFTSNRVIDTKNFVNQNSIYQMHDHGTMVLSTMAALDNQLYTGTAPNAAYAFYVSEDAETETPKELLHWVQAAERADSVGVDLINTSLGYTTFDDSRYDYTYEEMNGRTTIISKGAEIAASRGIFVVNAMGNDGGNNWHYISAPSDAPNVFSVGANTINFSPAYFSSYGPNADNLNKPNVSAMGQSTAVYRPDGSLTLASGTSFSSPIMAGSIASLMSAYPNVSIQELKTKIEQSAHLYPNYQEQLGYGVPNFRMIIESLKTNEIQRDKINISPNPTKNWVKIESNQNILKIEVIDLSGKLIQRFTNQKEINLERFPKGMYLMKIHLKDGQIHTEKIIKK